MRDDQIKRMAQLQEKLCECVLLEADPDYWPGANMMPIDMSQEERGDRYWCKKNAAATFTLLNKVMSLSHWDKGSIALPGQAEQELDKEIKKAERDANKQLEEFQRRRRLKVVS